VAEGVIAAPGCSFEGTTAAGAISLPLLSDGEYHVWGPNCRMRLVEGEHALYKGSEARPVRAARRWSAAAPP